MSFLKSVLLTFGIFVFIGVGCWGYCFFEQEKNADKTLALVKDLYEKSNYDEAIKKVDENKTFKNKEELLYYKFVSLMELEKFYEAEVISKDLLKLNPKNDEYYYLLGLLYYNNEDYPKSIQAFNKACEIQPKNIDYKLNLARIFTHNDENDKAIEEYTQIMKQDPRYEVAWDELAGIYDLRGDKKEVLKIRQEAAKKFSNNSYDQYMLGVIYEDLKMKNEAIKALKKAVDLEPEADNDAKDRLEKLMGKPYSVAFGKQEKIPLLGVGNLLIADAKVNDLSGKFLIDTGAETSIIYERFIKKNNVNVEVDTYGVLQMANGHTSFAPATYVDLQLGNNVIEDTRVYIMPNNKAINLDGIIGMDILNNFGFQVDKDNETLILNK